MSSFLRLTFLLGALVTLSTLGAANTASAQLVSYNFTNHPEALKVAIGVENGKLWVIRRGINSGACVSESFARNNGIFPAIVVNGTRFSDTMVIVGDGQSVTICGKTLQGGIFPANQISLPFTLKGWSGGDILYGNGNTHLFGDDGADTLVTVDSPGNTVEGGFGNDTLMSINRLGQVKGGYDNDLFCNFTATSVDGGPGIDGLYGTGAPATAIEAAIPSSDTTCSDSLFWVFALTRNL